MPPGSNARRESSLTRLVSCLMLTRRLVLSCHFDFRSVAVRQEVILRGHGEGDLGFETAATSRLTYPRISSTTPQAAPVAADRCQGCGPLRSMCAFARVWSCISRKDAHVNSNVTKQTRLKTGCAPQICPHDWRIASRSARARDGVACRHFHTRIMACTWLGFADTDFASGFGQC